MWEDIKNKPGGRWLIQLPPAKNNPSIDECWKNIVRFNYFCINSILNFKIGLFQVLSIIGEVYEHSNEINGAILNVRIKGTKIAVWTKYATGDNIMAIGYVMIKKKLLKTINNNINNLSKKIKFPYIRQALLHNYSF